MGNESPVNYDYVMKQYNQYGRGRYMKRFRDDEGYNYEKFARYSRKD